MFPKTTFEKWMYAARCKHKNVCMGMPRDESTQTQKYGKWPGFKKRQKEHNPGNTQPDRTQQAMK